MKKKKGIIGAAVFVILTIIINNLLNYMLVQPGLARTIFHESKAGDYQCIILGASHGSYGISTEEIKENTGLKTMNMCMGGEYMYDSYYTLKYALKYNKPSLVILDVDYQYMVNQHDESILFNSIYNAYPRCKEKLGYFFDKMIWEEYRGTFMQWTNYWQCYKKIDKTVAMKRTDKYKNYDSSVVSLNPHDNYMGNGFVYRNSDYKKSTTSCIEWDESKVDDDEIDYMEKIVKLCRKNNIEIVFTSVCQDPETIARKVHKFEGADTYIQNLAQELGVEYYNFNKLTFQAFARTTEDFYDREGHMYGVTSVVFSEIMGQVIDKHIKKTLNKSEYFAESMTDLYSTVKFTWQQ